MTFNTNRTARKLREHLGQPKQYTHGPWQWVYVEAVHAPRSTTLSAAAAAGALSITTAASIEANAQIIVGNGGPVEVQSVSGSGPYTVTLSGRGVPNAQNSGATVRVLATVDLYLDGWQNPPQNLPSGVSQTLTTGIRYLSSYPPLAGHVVLLARGTGLQRSDRVVMGVLAPAANPAGRMYNTSVTGLTNNVTVQITSMAADFAVGGVKIASNALTVAVPGRYLISASLGSLNLAGNAVVPSGPTQCIVDKNGSSFRRANLPASSDYPTPGFSTIETLAAGDSLTLWGAQSSGSTAFCDPAGGNLQSAWLSVALQSHS